MPNTDSCIVGQQCNEVHEKIRKTIVLEVKLVCYGCHYHPESVDGRLTKLLFLPHCIVQHSCNWDYFNCLTFVYCWLTFSRPLHGANKKWECNREKASRRAREMVLLATVVCQMCLSVNAKEKKYVSGIDFFLPAYYSIGFIISPFVDKWVEGWDALHTNWEKISWKCKFAILANMKNLREKIFFSLFQFMCLFNCDFCFRFNFCWCNCVAK